YTAARAALPNCHGGAADRRTPAARARGLLGHLHPGIHVHALPLSEWNPSPSVYGERHLGALGHFLYHLDGRHRADRLCLPQISNIEDDMRRHPLLTILMAITGVILVLPGVCAAGFMVLGGLRSPDPSIISLWLVCFLIAAGGGFLLYKAFQQPTDPDDRPTSS